MSPLDLGAIDAFLIEVRALVGSVRIRFLMMAKDPVSWFVVLAEPLIAATLLGVLMRSGSDDAYVTRIVTGSALMSVWSATVLASAGSLDYERYIGTLEHTVAAPARLVSVIFGRCLGGVAFGLVIGTIMAVWTAWLAGRAPRIVEPLPLVAAVLLGSLALTAMATVASTVFVVVPAADGIVNVMSYPVWLISGVFVAVAELPEVIGWLAYLLPTTWIWSLLDAAMGGTGTLSSAVVLPLLAGSTGVCLIAAGYAVAAVERRATVQATLQMSM